MSHKHHHNHHHNSRRNFLKTMGCASMSLTPMLSTITNLGLLNAAAANNMPYFSSGDYKALICLALDGGNDSFNMLVPYEDTPYNEYAAARGPITAIPKADLLQIDSNGTSYGLHPNMQNLKSIYNDGNLAFVANVGTLVNKDTTLAQYNSGSNLPLGLYSHIDQLSLWQTSLPSERSNIGWSGRMADLLQSQCNPNSNVSMNISLGGANIFQTGNIVNQYNIKDTGSQSLGSPGNFWQNLKLATVDNVMSESYQNILKSGYSDIVQSATSNGGEFNDATGNIMFPDDAFPSTGLGNQLKMVAKTIIARDTLNMNRQVFYVKFGGFDTHGSSTGDGNPVTDHADRLLELDEALQSFWSFMDANYLIDKVSLFTMSDFGRTLAPNDDIQGGTDHGWGGNAMVMGGAVKGGEIYGEYPETLALGSNLDTGEGRLIPTTSCDEYFRDLALWFGQNDSSSLISDLATILPNIGNFGSPLGFMNY